MAITKSFSWSYTALIDFENCPRAYAAKRVYKTVKEEESEALRWGNAVHKALELRVRDKTPLPDSMKQWDKYAIAFERSKNYGILCESEYATNRALKLVAWFANDAWSRFKVDVTLLKDKGVTACIYDYKTGKVKDDETQLRLFGLIVLRAMPEVERVFAYNIWLKHNQVSAPVCTMRDWEMKEWQKIIPRVRRMEEAWKHENFPERQSGLCKAHCPVIDCLHNGKRR